MTKTVFVTGASSGIGKATALHFHRAGWNVVATMRRPEDGEDLAALKNLLVERLDVLDDASIRQSVQAAVDRFGAIDVLVNNAGYGAYGPLEAFGIDGIRRQFDTNVLGLLMVTKAVLPHMRARRRGVVVNVSSVGGRMTFPLGTLYHGTKFAVEGLSEALHFELAEAGIGVKIIEPGMVRTDFAGRSFDFTNDEALVEYQPLVGKVLGSFAALTEHASDPAVIADIIFGAATDGTAQLRYAAGADAVELMKNRSALDDETFIGGVKAQMGIGA